METLEPIEIQIDRCEKYRNVLLELARIHTEIDTATREVRADEPDWVFRLRKVCLHTVAITKSDIDVDGVHAITTELRAAYEQMHEVWKCLPEEFRFEQDRSWWVNEARNLLAAYNHPTPMSLEMPLSLGGFGEAEDPQSYLRLACWLGRLGCGYGLAVRYLARELKSEDGMDARLVSALGKVPN